MTAKPPHFVIIGAAKCATTSLAAYLGAHPGIAMSRPKETNFFSYHWDKGVDHYARFFPNDSDDLLLGDASPSYAKAPLVGGVPERLAAVAPDVRLVYLVRHPIERMRSDFLHRLYEGSERAARLEDVALANPWYLTASRYGYQLDQYLEHFDGKQLLVLRTEDLRARRQEVVRQVLAFIGADPDELPPNLSEMRNRADEKVRLDPRLDGARAAWRGARSITGRLPSGWRDRIQRRLSRPIPAAATQLSPGLEARLWDELEPDLRRLREIVGPEMDLWGRA